MSGVSGEVCGTFSAGQAGITDPEFLRGQTEGLEQLCQIFDVEPAKEVAFHDGVSSILVPEESKNEAFRWLYPLKDEDTAQAERIAHLLKDSRNDGTLSMQLCAYAVAWVLLNPKVLPPLECYSRHHTSRYAQHLLPKAKIFLTAPLK